MLHQAISVSIMKIYRLTHPSYYDDWDFMRRNPIESIYTHRVPGIDCEVCGRWAYSKRLRIPLPAESKEFEKIRFLPVAEWRACLDRWSKLLGIPADELEPSTIGPPVGKCKRRIVEDVVHAGIGQIWIRERVRDAFLSAGLSGVSFAKVMLNAKCGVDLWEIVVHGRAWRKGSTPEKALLCEICGRRGFPSPNCLAVDETRWDGSDFFNVDFNENITLVTERVAEVIAANRFTNVATVPID